MTGDLWILRACYSVSAKMAPYSSVPLSYKIQKSFRKSEGGEAVLEGLNMTLALCEIMVCTC